MKRIAPYLVALVAVMTLSACGRTIDSGHRGVYYNWRSGTDTQYVLGEGFHWVLPWNRVVSYDIRTKDRLEKLTGLSQDQLQIRCDVSVRFSLVPGAVGKLHAKVGRDFYRMIIQPVLRNATRDIISGFASIDAYRQRSEIQEKIEKRLLKSLERYPYFSVERVMLRAMEFPEVVVQAIEQKLAKKQEVEREKYQLEKARIVAQRKVVEAEATAKAQAILKAELNDTLLRWKGIEATMALAESPNTKVVVVGGKDGLPLILGGAGK